MLCLQNVNKTQRPVQEVHVRHVIPSFWYRIEHDPCTGVDCSTILHTVYTIL